MSVCEDKLEVRYKLDSSRDAEVLRSSVKNLANGQLHTVIIGRQTDSVSVQVTCSHPTHKAARESFWCRVLTRQLCKAPCSMSMSHDVVMLNML